MSVYYVVVKVFFQGPEATCLGVFRSKRDAVEAIEADEEVWNEEFRIVDEDFWGSEEASAIIEEREIE